MITIITHFVPTPVSQLKLNLFLGVNVLIWTCNRIPKYDLCHDIILHVIYVFKFDTEYMNSFLYILTACFIFFLSVYIPIFSKF